MRRQKSLSPVRPSSCGMLHLATGQWFEFPRMWLRGGTDAPVTEPSAASAGAPSAADTADVAVEADAGDAAGAAVGGAGAGDARGHDRGDRNSDRGGRSRGSTSPLSSSQTLAARC